MIQLTCTQCRTVLSIDDAFAGGVCRCQHCGTIQTVPAQRKARPTTPGADDGPAAMVSAPPPAPMPPQPPKPPQSRTTAQPPPPQPRQTAPPPPPPPAPVKPAAAPAAPAPGPVARQAPDRGDLQNLAQAVAVSSGLRAGRLQRADGYESTTPVLMPEGAEGGMPAEKKRMIILGAAIAGLVLLIVVIVIATRNGGNTNNNAAGGGTNTGGTNTVTPNVPGGDTSNDPAFTMTQPNFLGVPIEGPLVMLLDRGSGTEKTFEALKGGAALSLKSMNPSVRFQVIFWQTESTLASPMSGTIAATPTSVSAARKVIGQAVAFGSTTIDKPLDLALASKPAEIALVTGKFGLDSEFAKKVLEKATKNPGMKVHTFALGQVDSAGALKDIAAKTGGTFRELDAATLKELQNHTISFDSE